MKKTFLSMMLTTILMSAIIAIPASAATGWSHPTPEKYYYYKNNGELATGLYTIGKDTYYFSEDSNNLGVMWKEWKKMNGDWYYFNPTSGLRTSGWLLYNRSYYYFDNDGKMVTGFKTLNKSDTYYFSENPDSPGYMCTGWKKINNDWYYFNPTSGLRTSGWLKYDGLDYYLDKDGKMVTGLYSPDKDHTYYFNEAGHSLGGLCHGWKQIGNDWYYFNKDTGNMTKGLFSDTPLVNPTTGNITTRKYYFDNDGKMVTGWLKLAPGKKCYFSNSSEDYGRMKIGNANIDGIDYQFDKEGILKE